MPREEVAKGLQAVVIASAISVHAEQAIKAIELGLHVLCEKPLSTNVEIVSPANPAPRAPTHLQQPPSNLILTTFRSRSRSRPQSQPVCTAYTHSLETRST
jgi:myo-inositol 2-dehydrogenase / D-chiro-inositol 1-dehydrogenase